MTYVNEFVFGIVEFNVIINHEQHASECSGAAAITNKMIMTCIYIILQPKYNLWVMYLSCNQIHDFSDALDIEILFWQDTGLIEVWRTNNNVLVLHRYSTQGLRYHKPIWRISLRSTLTSYYHAAYKLTHYSFGFLIFLVSIVNGFVQCCYCCVLLHIDESVFNIQIHLKLFMPPHHLRKEEVMGESFFTLTAATHQHTPTCLPARLVHQIFFLRMSQTCEQQLRQDW